MTAINLDEQRKQYISLVNDRANRLHETVAHLPTATATEQTHSAWVSLNELSVALEELSMAETERQAQHEALLESRQSLEEELQHSRSLFDCAPDGYLVTDPVGHICDANQRAAELFNTVQQRLAGKRLISFVPQSERSAFHATLNRLPQLGRLQNWNVTLLKRRTGEFKSSVSVQVEYNEAGQAIALYWLIREATPQLSESPTSWVEGHTEQQPGAEMGDCQCFKDKYVAQVTHDLRSPLNSVIGCAELLRRRTETSDDTTQKLTQSIVRGGKQLLTLIDTLLDLSRAKAQKLTLLPESFDVKALVNEIVTDMQSLAEQKSLHLVFDCTVPELMMLSDPTRLQQVLVNLISNAIKFTEAGTILVNIEPLEQSRVLISVHDTGVGIHPDDVPHIFEEFWQAKRYYPAQKRDTLSPGSGLGLCITKTLVELLQGTIAVESLPHQGSTFSVNLPLHIDAEAADFNTDSK